MPQPIIRRRMSLKQLTRGYEDLPAAVRANPIGASFALASEILRAFFDPEWAERHIISDDYKRGFMSIDESRAERQEITFFGGMDLVEVIYNLQNVPASTNATTCLELCL